MSRVHAGANGTDGTNGKDGATILSGSGAPNDVAGGNVGDYYLDTSSGTLYGPKTSDTTNGGWPTSGTPLIGPKGDTGAAGKDGTTIRTSFGPPLAEFPPHLGDFDIDVIDWVIYGPMNEDGWPAGTPLIGPMGETGAPGKDGATILSGNGTPTGGNDGDYYLDTANSTLYGPKADGEWPGDGTSLKGDPGTNGTDGKDGKDGKEGPAGKDGTTILSGAGAPDNSLGSDGDFYFDTDAGVLYGPKADDAWPATGTSLKGATGDTGAAGITNIVTAQNITPFVNVTGSDVTVLSASINVPYAATLAVSGLTSLSPSSSQVTCLLSDGTSSSPGASLAPGASGTIVTPMSLTWLFAVDGSATPYTVSLLCTSPSTTNAYDSGISVEALPRSPG